MSDASSLIEALNQQNSAAIGAALNTWTSYPLATIKTIASEFTTNEELAAAIEKSLNAPNAGQKDDFVCRWLYQWYQLDTLETRLFVLRYIPQLLWVYLFNVANSEAPAGVEACLLCIYNVEVEQRGDGEIIFHPPTLSLPSYLHKSSLSSPSPHGQQTLHLHLQQPYDALAPPAFNAPGTAGPSSGLSGPSYGLGPSPSSSAVPALTENALRQFNKQAKQVTVEKALRPIGVVTAANRGAVVRVALQRYNNYISLIPPRSWVSYCKMCKRLVNFGFDFTITPLPLIKSKSFSKKYIEEDMDNLAIDSDEDFEYDEDDFPDELSDSDGEKEKDVEKGAIIVQEGESAHNGKDKKSKKKHLKEPSSSNLNSSSPKIPPLNIVSSSSPSPTRSSSHNNLSSPSSPSSSSSSPPISPKNTTSITPRDNNNTTDKGKGKAKEGENVQDGKENEREKDKEISTNVTIPNKPPTRIVIPATCLQEMVTGLTFCIFKDSYKEDAVKALRKLHLRACFDLMPEIILSANALLHLEYQDRNKNAVAAELPGKTTPRGPASPVNLLTS